MNANDVVITGIGLVSALGEGAAVHWERLSAGGVEPVVVSERYAPFSIHPMPAIDWSLQIPKRGDQRQMENWQRLGTYTAGLALDDAGLKGNEELCSTMDMVVAAGGGERDQAVDEAILAQSLDRSDLELLLNEKLTTELRPTLFLAQLSNLLAGNISIVHKVTGSSRTFMGEEGAGLSAVDTASARIRSGQATHVLVGGAYATDHPDMLLGYELGGYLHRGPYAPLWQRARSAGGGLISGSGGAFLVLESRAHAEARGARIYASLGKVASGRVRRTGDALDRALDAMLADAAIGDGPLLAVSAASGAHAATAAEKEAYERRGKVAARAFSALTGHLRESQFVFAVALAALAVKAGGAFPPIDPASEAPLDGAPDAVLATAVGYHVFEGMALVSRADRA